MKTHDDHLDQLINAHLDGQLDAAQRAELFRELLRSPEARERLDRATALDQLVGETLRGTLDAPRPSAVHKPNTPWHRVTAIAAAAMVLIAVGLWSAQALRSPDAPALDQPTPVVQIEPAPIERAPVELAVEAEAPQPVVMAVAEESAPWWHRQAVGETGTQAAPIAPVPNQTHLPEARKGRAVIGVLDETTDRFYWLEIERERSVIESVVGEL